MGAASLNRTSVLPIRKIVPRGPRPRQPKAGIARTIAQGCGYATLWNLGGLDETSDGGNHASLEILPFSLPGLSRGTPPSAVGVC
jgi:hypothetical protein